MRVRFQDGFREIEIVGRGSTVARGGWEPGLASLRRLLRDPENRAKLRRAFAEEIPVSALARMSDEEVLGELARRMAGGELILLERHGSSGGSSAPPPSQGSTPRQDEQAAKAEAPVTESRSAAPQAASPAAAASDPALAGMDAAAQAATLRAAAESGAPLCEA